MGNKIAIEREAKAAKYRQGKLQAAGLLISNAIHALADARRYARDDGTAL